jgi:hypothetical protein
MDIVFFGRLENVICLFLNGLRPFLIVSSCRLELKGGEGPSTRLAGKRGMRVEYPSRVRVASDSELCVVI